LHQQVLVTSLGSTILLGVVLLVLRTARRRASLELRLKAIAIASLDTDQVGPLLRRPQPQRRPLPANLLTRLDVALAATGNRIGLPHVVATAALAGSLLAIAVAATHTRAVLALAVVVAAALGAPALLVRLAQTRNQRLFLDIFPDALDLIVRAVRAGLPVLKAIELTAQEVSAPVGFEFERILGEIRIGVEIEDALRNAADRIRVPDFRFFVVSVLLQRQTGGGIAEILSGLSTIIRQRKALRTKARALTAEATASTAVVAAMPFIAGGGLFVVNRDMMSVLFVDPRGRFMLGVAVAGLLLGLVAMKAIVRKCLR
jgi:tight adherence protein B